MLTRFSDFRDWPFAAAPRRFGAFDLLKELDRLMSDGDADGFESRGAYPKLTFADQGGAFVIRAEVPGLTEKDLELSATANTLTLRGERKVDAPEGYSVHRSERSAFRFARSYDLPAKVDHERVEARLEHGVLTVTLPKAPEAQPKQITVKVS